LHDYICAEGVEIPNLATTLDHTTVSKRNKVDLVICIGTTEQEENLCKANDAVFFKFPNNPLGMKWNYGFKMAKTYKPDAVLFVGSSDWLSDNWLPELTPYLKDFEMVGTPDVHFIDIGKHTRVLRACHWPGYQCSRKDEPIGIGRLIRADILDKIDWTPFEDRKNNSMDFTMMNRILQKGGRVKNVADAPVKSLAVSCDQWDNKHKFTDHYNQKLPSKIISPKLIIEEFPEVMDIFTGLKFKNAD